ncbi:MAG: hypothetical protein K0S53_1784 [Bacteroidetes bacterium]|jgi:hypothetical protein|nr:hypothetical protein [Bacteroidota bacterium]MDF2452273.1 hypothetical protein [Bacteroidota bacterium]
MNPLLSVFDLLLTPFYIIGAYIYAYWVTKKNIREKPEYAYFTKGLMVRIFGAIAIGVVYFFYYDGGDTTNYYQTSSAYAKLFLKDQDDFWIGWLGDGSKHYFTFNESTGYPVYTPKDHHSFFVVRLLIPIVTLGFHSYFSTAVLVACFTYGGMWKLYQTFLMEFPNLKKEFAIACLFIPSCVFWGSGLMKDSFTLSAVGWFTYAFYHFFIKKQRKLSYGLYLFMSGFIILAIKPYIFFALLPGSILWLSNNMVKKINHGFIRLIASPVILGIGVLTGYIALDKMGDNLGQYKLDTVLDKAVVTQKDMKAEYYGGKTYDIGDFDASIIGIISKAPIAIFSGIFRPGIWDVKNPVMLISSLENSYLLFLTVFLLFKLKFLGFFTLIRKNPMLLFCMLFSLFFAFSVGLTVANFGSLVRLRIPELPFFVAGIFMLRHLYEQQSGVKMKF